MKGAKDADACGSIGTEKRRKPYAPIFSSTPARMTEPAVGASTCASGSQVWTGHIGTFTAKEAKKASHIQICRLGGKRKASRLGISVVPAARYMARIASSISTEPVSVKRKNLKAA